MSSTGSTEKDMNMKLPDGIPLEWTKVSPVGNGAIINLFFIFKKPIGRSTQISPSNLRFTPQMVFDIVHLQGSKLKLWINLSSSQDYNLEEVKSNKAVYVKLCPNTLEMKSEEIPTSYQLRFFCNIINSFLETRASANDKEFIGIHSNLSYNRVGFFICAYLVQYKSMSLECALEAFRACRPHGIYNHGFANALCNLYSSIANERNLVCKEPEWLPIDHRNQLKENPAFYIPTLANVKPETDSQLIGKVQKEVQNICNWTSGGFPGRTIRTLGKDSMHFLKERPYLIERKADGRRYNFYINGQLQCFFIDRENTVFTINSKVEMDNCKMEYLKSSLFDGEVILDKNGNGVYIIFDVLHYSNENLTKLGFGYRFERLLLDEAIILDGLNSIGIELKFELTNIFHMSQIENLLLELKNNMDELKYDYDGLIFEDLKLPFQGGHSETVFKWKPPRLSSIDFLLKIDEKNRCNGYLYVKSLLAPFGKILITPELELEQFNNKIIECLYKNRRWIFLRDRPERIDPNEFSTAMEVVNNILRPVTMGTLMSNLRPF